MKKKNSKPIIKKNLVPITINLPQEWADHLNLLKKETGKSESFYMKKALQMYLEDLEDLEVGLRALKSKSKTYTSREADQKIKELSKNNQKPTIKNV